MIRQRPTVADAACLALLVLITLSTGRALLIAALNTPETLAQAEALKGM
jgi:hypothetical protein